MFNKVMLAAAVTVLSTLSLSTPAEAGYRQYNLHDRMARQNHRIKQGVRHGLITPRELKRLRKQQKRIKRLKREFRSDGYLSKHERQNPSSQNQ